MNDPGKRDFDTSSDFDDNKSEVFLAYDHPMWNELENEPNKLSTFPIINTTMTTLQPPPSPYELNRQKSLTFTPVFVTLGCIMVLGILCNILVCYIYRCRSRRKTSNFFVIFFAIFDMGGCLVVIPVELTALALPYIYDTVAMCKIMGFVESWAVCAQCSTLICVSYDCYRKLCRPETEFNVKKARLCCIMAVIVAVLVSIPALVVFGTNKENTSRKNGLACSVDEEHPKWLRNKYYICVLGMFTLALCVMTVMYCLIGVGWCKQRQAEERGEKPSPAKREFPKKHRFVREDTSTSSMTNYSEDRSHQHKGSISHSSISRSDPSHVPLKSGSGIVKTNSLQASNSPPAATLVQLHVKHTRQASIFTVISIIFVVTMLPYVVVMILCATTHVFKQFSSNTTEIIYNLCIRSYLFNYFDKPVVYIIFNVNFRRQVKVIFSTVWAKCTFNDITTKNASRQLRRTSTMGPSRSASRTPIYRPPRNTT